MRHLEMTLHEIIYNLTSFKSIDFLLLLHANLKGAINIRFDIFLTRYWVCM